MSYADDMVSPFIRETDGHFAAVFNLDQDLRCRRITPGLPPGATVVSEHGIVTVAEYLTKHYQCVGVFQNLGEGRLEEIAGWRRGRSMARDPWEIWSSTCVGHLVSGPADRLTAGIDEVREAASMFAAEHVQ